MYLTRIAGIEPGAEFHDPGEVLMYLTRIAGIEPIFRLSCVRTPAMYLTRIAGIEQRLVDYDFALLYRCILPA